MKPEKCECGIDKYRCYLHNEDNDGTNFIILSTCVLVFIIVLITFIKTCNG